MKKLLFISILLISLLSFSVNAISYENSKFKLTVTPDIAYDWEGEFEQFYSIKSKLGTDVCVNGAFAFEQKIDSGGIYRKLITNKSHKRMIYEQVIEQKWNDTTTQIDNITFLNNTRNETYYEVSNYYSSNKISTTYNNLNPQTYGFESSKNNVYLLDNQICIKSGETLEGKWNYKTPGSGKWDLLLYTNNLVHKIELDPWFNISTINIDMSTLTDTNTSATNAKVDNYTSVIRLGGNRLSFINSINHAYNFSSQYNDTVGDSDGTPTGIVFTSDKDGNSNSAISVGDVGSDKLTFTDNVLSSPGFVNLWLKNTATCDNAGLLEYIFDGENTGTRFDVAVVNTEYQSNLGGTWVSGGDCRCLVNTWQNLLITYNNTNLFMYLNGSLCHSAAGLTGGAVTGTRLGGDGGANPWIGDIDQFITGNKMLNSSEASEMYALDPFNKFQFYEPENNYWQSNVFGINNNNSNSKFDKITYDVTANNITSIDLGYSCDNGTSWASATNGVRESCATRGIGMILNATLHGHSNYTPSISSILALLEYSTTEGFGQLLETRIIDYDTDGTNFGESSEGWTTGESVLKNISAISNSDNSILIIKHTESNEIINIYDQNTGILLVNLPSIASDSGTYIYTSVLINSSQYINDVLTLNITADSANTDPVYIDYIGLANLQSNATLVGNGSWLTLIGQITGVGIKVLTKITNDDNSQYLNTSAANLTSSNFNYITVYQVGQSVNGNYAFNFMYNESDDNYFTIEPNYTVQFDSTSPVINFIVVDTDVLMNELINFTVNVTELNPHYVQASVSDSSVANINLTNTNPSSTNGNWTGTFEFINTSAKTITVLVVDNVTHRANQSIIIRVSNVSNTSSLPVLNNTFSYTYHLPITDTETGHTLNLKIINTLNSNGDAYIDDFNMTSSISDTYPRNISMVFTNGTHYDNMFADNTTSLNWKTEAWNDSLATLTSFTNNITYNIEDAARIEWENTGVGDERLFHIVSSNMSSNITSVYFNMTLRTAFDGSSDRLSLKECTGSITWETLTCSQWTVRTTMLYSQNDTTLHSGLSSEYPTVSTNNDSNKEALIIILNLPVNGEQMWSTDLDSGTAETLWTTTTSDDSSSSSGGGGGSATTTAIASSTASITAPVKDSAFKQYLQSILDAISPLINFIGDIFKTITDFISGLFSSLTAGVGEGQSFFILVIMIVLAMSFLLISGGNGGNKKTRGDFSL